MKKVKRILYMLTLMFTFNIVVNAESKAELLYDGIDKIEMNKEFYQIIKVSNIEGADLNALNATITVDDNSCVTITNIEPLDTLTQSFENRFIYVNFNATKESENLIKVTYKSNDKVCSTNINLEEQAIAFNNGDFVEPTTVSKQINVIKSENVGFISYEDKNIEKVLKVEEKDDNEIRINKIIDRYKNFISLLRNL